MEVRPGYKQTEVGVIPEDWEIDSIGAITDIQVGRDLHEEQFSQLSDSTYRFPVYSNTVADEGLYGFYSTAEYEGDSLTVVGRGVGLGTAFARKGGYGAIGRLLVLMPNGRADAKYLVTYINQRVSIFVETGGIPQLTGIQFSKYKVALPPLPEQHAIAAALSDVDGLLGGLDRLIAKKRDLKQAAMQGLLTPPVTKEMEKGKWRRENENSGDSQFSTLNSPLNIRLPGFHGEWTMKPIALVAPLQRGFDLPTRELTPGPYPVVYSNGVEAFHSKFMVKGPGVVTGRSGTLGRVHYVEADFWPHNTSLWVTRFGGNVPRFIFYLYDSLRFERFASGSGVPTLNRNDAHTFRVAIPADLDEQRAIAAVLSDMDAELAALEARRGKTRALKQAMMQELLTGRTRLVNG